MSEPDGWDALFSRRTLGVRMGLGIVQGVFEAMGRPGEAIAAVHVVGTNGKGSTAAMVEHALRGRGWRTGLYTSPHLRRVGERVRVDGEAVADERLRAHVRAVLGAEAGLSLARPLSFFELLTLAALDLLAAAGVEVLVVEAGLGGRLDATRLVSPTVVAITSIALDHQAILGDTLAAIAAEKAAVMRAGVPTVSARQGPEAAAVIEARAAEVGSPLVWASPLPRAPVGLAGAHQRSNAAVALLAARVLEPAIGPEALDGVRWPGRLEVVPWGGGTLVLDVAHNPAGIAAVVDAVEAGAVPQPSLVLFGCQADKDGPAMVQALERLALERWWVGPEPGLPPVGGAAAWSATFGSERIAAALEAMRSELARGAVVLVCGSHKLVGAVLAAVHGDLGEPDPQDPRPVRT
ncbi:MAG: bifunctional folylpolyglutamate synthase/dihydrofolate synthase [Myxococcales bacterium]|nr:bifunctional folylpolyglutamate synthase/dihydrofolate synthase [Myxococcales bacterium]